MKGTPAYQGKLVQHPEIHTILVLPTPVQTARAAADAISGRVRTFPSMSITWATGNTQAKIHEYLVEDQNRGYIDFTRTQAFHLDEYWPCSQDEPHSFVRYLREHVLTPLNIPERNIHTINGSANDAHAESERYDKLLKNIKLAILGIGPVDDPHIGFNPPGTDFSLRTHREELTQATIIRDQVERGQKSPNQAITQGIANILEAGEIFLIAYGKKGLGLKKALYEPISPAQPASALRTVGEKVTIFLDTEAASYL